MRYNPDITLEAAQSLVDAIMVRIFVFSCTCKQSDVAVAIPDAGKKDLDGGVQWYTDQSAVGER